MAVQINHEVWPECYRCLMGPRLNRHHTGYHMYWCVLHEITLIHMPMLYVSHVMLNAQQSIRGTTVGYIPKI